MFDQASNVSQCQWLKTSEIYSQFLWVKRSNTPFPHKFPFWFSSINHHHPQLGSPTAKVTADPREFTCCCAASNDKNRCHVGSPVVDGEWWVYYYFMGFTMFYYRMIYVFFNVLLWENTEILVQFHQKPSPMVVEGVKPYMGWCKMTQLMVHEPMSPWPPYAAMKSWLSCTLWPVQPALLIQ